MLHYTVDDDISQSDVGNDQTYILMQIMATGHHPTPRRDKRRPPGASDEETVRIVASEEERGTAVRKRSWASHEIQLSTRIFVFQSHRSLYFCENSF